MVITSKNIPINNTLNVNFMLLFICNSSIIFNIIMILNPDQN